MYTSPIERLNDGQAVYCAAATLMFSRKVITTMLFTYRWQLLNALSNAPTVQPVAIWKVRLKSAARG